MTSRPTTTATTDSRVEHENAALFVLVLTYTSPLPTIDAVMPAHRRFLDEFFASGEFLAAGPREPRVGGVILARATDRTRVDELIAADPFTQRGLASYDVIAFVPNRGPFALPLRATMPAYSRMDGTSDGTGVVQAGGETTKLVGPVVANSAVS